MGVRAWLGLDTPADPYPQVPTDPAVEPLTETAALGSQLELVTEALVDAQMALDDAGWRRISGDDTGLYGLNLHHIRQRVWRARLLARANPLIRRGLHLRHFYVWGAGVSIQARATGPDLEQPGAQDVNAVVQAFLDDPGNQRVLTSSVAREECEQALGTDGNLFLACFTSPRTGMVQVRSLAFDEIDDVITNPDDRSEPWYYRRRHMTTLPNPLSAPQGGETVTYYPALGYRPQTRPKALGDGNIVMWDAPVLHVAVNRPHGSKWGLPDAYAATYWADLYRDFLVDWSKLVKALSKFAWKATSSDRTRRAVRDGLTRTLAAQSEAGAAAVMSPDTVLEAVPKTGATIDSGSGRPVAAMVAAALDVPVTMLLGDPGVTGARATAETLDRPTELMAMTRRAMWTGHLQTLLSYVVDQAVKAPAGPLRGAVVRDDFDRERITLAGDTDRTVEVTWPDLTETPINFVMQALVAADQIGKTPPLVLARLVLQALGVQDVDEVLEDMVDPDTGEFIDPGVTAGQAAVDAFRNGRDPAALLAGQAPAATPATAAPSGQ